MPCIPNAAQTINPTGKARIPIPTREISHPSIMLHKHQRCTSCPVNDTGPIFHASDVRQSQGSCPRDLPFFKLSECPIVLTVSLRNLCLGPRMCERRPNVPRDSVSYHDAQSRRSKGDIVRSTPPPPETPSLHHRCNPPHRARDPDGVGCQVHATEIRGCVCLQASATASVQVSASRAVWTREP